MKNVSVITPKFDYPLILFEVYQAYAAFLCLILMLSCAALQICLNYCFFWDTQDISRYITILLLRRDHHVDFDRAVNIFHLFHCKCLLLKIALLKLIPHLFYWLLYLEESLLGLIKRHPLRVYGLHETAKPNSRLHSRIILILYYILQIHDLVTSDSCLTIDFFALRYHLISSAPP